MNLSMSCYNNMIIDSSSTLESSHPRVRSFYATTRTIHIYKNKLQTTKITAFNVLKNQTKCYERQTGKTEERTERTESSFWMARGLCRLESPWWARPSYAEKYQEGDYKAKGTSRPNLPDDMQMALNTNSDYCEPPPRTVVQWLMQS